VTYAFSGVFLGAGYFPAASAHQHVRASVGATRIAGVQPSNGNGVATVVDAVLLVLVIGVANLALGFAIGTFLMRP